MSLELCTAFDGETAASVAATYIQKQFRPVRFFAAVFVRWCWFTAIIRLLALDLVVVSAFWLIVGAVMARNVLCSVVNTSITHSRVLLQVRLAVEPDLVAECIENASASAQSSNGSSSNGSGSGFGGPPQQQQRAQSQFAQLHGQTRVQLAADACPSWLREWVKNKGPSGLAS